MQRNEDVEAFRV